MEPSTRQLSSKQRLLEALRSSKEWPSIWVLLNGWKANETLPNDRHFSVLIYGPPKTFKEKLHHRFCLLWRNCSVTHRHEPRQGGLRFEEMAGYDLIIRTHRVTKAINGLSTHYEAATVDKSRFVALPIGRTEHPKYYRLTPIEGPW